MGQLLREIAVYLVLSLLFCTKMESIDGLSFTIDLSAPLAEVDEVYLSVSIDASQISCLSCVTCTPYDFASPQLAYLAAQLAPVLIRIGGTNADATYFSSSDRIDAPPPGFQYLLCPSVLSQVFRFASNLTAPVVFGINAGPGPRNTQGDWEPSNLLQLLNYTFTQGYLFSGLEFGNEPNLFFFAHDFFVDGSRYGDDFLLFAAAVKQFYNQRRVSVPLLISTDLAYQLPVVGPLDPFFMESFAQKTSDQLQILTWHWYPWEASKCPLSWLDLATPEKVLDPAQLDKGREWATYQLKLASKFRTNPTVWLGETSSAACGGEPGVSDAFASGFFWLDQLGYMATLNQKVVIRQTLAGGTYALLRGPGSQPVPSPDYFSSIIWKRTMGQKVLSVVVNASSPLLRVYAHCTPSGSPASGGLTTLLINLANERVSVLLPQALSGIPRLEFHFTSTSLSSTSVFLNGKLLKLNSDGSLPSLDGSTAGPSPLVDLAPTSYSFITFIKSPSTFAAC